MTRTELSCVRLTDAGSLRALSRQVQDNFEESVAMSTYLVAMVVCDYTRLQDKTANGVAVSIYAPQHLISQAQFALNVSTLSNRHRCLANLHLRLQDVSHHPEEPGSPGHVVP